MDMDVYRHMDAYLQRLNAGANYNAPESQPHFSTSTMDLFSSESMLLDDVVDPFSSASMLLEGIETDVVVDPSFSSESMFLESIDDVIDTSLFSQDPGQYSYPVSSMLPSPSESMAYMPEYVPGPTISNIARSSNAACCELSDLPTIPISKSKHNGLYFYVRVNSDVLHYSSTPVNDILSTITAAHARQLIGLLPIPPSGRRGPTTDRAFQPSSCATTARTISI